MRKRILGIFLSICICSCFTVKAQELNVEYDCERINEARINYCAYNGSVYVMGGENGYLGVSTDLINWNEVKNVCYTDIDKIIWDGIDFIFISNHNVYRSNDGYNWRKAPCNFVGGSDFECNNGKYIVRQTENTTAYGLYSSKIGVTGDFVSFNEIDFGEAYALSDVRYAGSPNVYSIDNIYFAMGLIPNIVYSTNLFEWKALPVLPNNDNTNRELLLFTQSGSEYLIYYYENSGIVCYSIDKELENESSWKRTEINVGVLFSGVTMQKLDGTIYCFAPYGSIYSSNNGYDFYDSGFSMTGGYVVNNNSIPLWVENNKSLAVKDGVKKSSDIQSIKKYADDLIWIGKEYIRLDENTNQIMATTDKENYYLSDMSIDTYNDLITHGINTFIWTGEQYIGRVGGYEEPKLRGGALENGKKIFVYDKDFNFVCDKVFEGDVCDFSYCNDKLYIKVGALDDNTKFEVCSSKDMNAWTNNDKLNEVPVSNKKTVLNFAYDRGDNATTTYTSKDSIITSSIEVNDKYTEINYETKTVNHVYVLDDIYAARMTDSSGEYIGFSNDGVYYYKVKLPDDFVELFKIPANSKNIQMYCLGNKIVYEACGFRIFFDKDTILSHLNLQDEKTYVVADNKILGFDTEPVTENDRTLVPLRFIFETLGSDVDWEDSTQTAIVQNDDTTIKFSIDNTTATVNNLSKSMDVPARLINDKTLVPLRFLSEELGYDVQWNEETRTATISK